MLTSKYGHIKKNKQALPLSYLSDSNKGMLLVLSAQEARLQAQLQAHACTDMRTHRHGDQGTLGCVIVTPAGL